MIAEQNTYRYSYEFPEGKLFLEGEEIPEEFVDNPSLLGLNRLDSKTEIEKKCKEGIENRYKVKTVEKSNTPIKDDLSDLRDKYEKKFGKKPFHLMKEAGLRKALEDDC